MVLWTVALMLLGGATFVATPGATADAGISGTVRSSNGTPLKDVCVGVYQSRVFQGETKTASNGTYLVGGLGAGGYQLRFEDCGGNGVEYEFYENQPTFDDANTVSVTEGQITAGIDVALEPEGRISGLVTDIEGNPVAGVGVYAYRRYNSRFTVGFTETEANGRYLIGGLRQSSDYEVRFYPADTFVSQSFDGHSPVNIFGDYTPVSVISGQETPNIDAKLVLLTAPTGIAGTIRGSNGTPLQDICVGVYQSRVFQGETKTAVDGTYSVKDLVQGPYQMRFQDCGGNGVEYEFYENQPTFDDANSIAVKTGYMSTVDVVLAPAGRISGLVTDAIGNPVAGVGVYAYRRNNSRFTIGSTETEANGRYLIGGLREASDYEVRFYPAEPFISQSYDSISPVNIFGPYTQVSVVSGLETPNIDARLLQYISVAGTITDRRGNSVQGCNVTVGGKSAATDSAGGYEVTFAVPTIENGIPVIRYYASCPYPTYLEAVSGSVPVTNPSSAIVDLVVPLKNSISGIVTNSDGEPISGCSVSATARSGGLSTGVVTNSSGVFSFDPLLNGEYDVWVYCGGDYAPQFHDGTVDSEKVTPILLSGGDDRVINVQVGGFSSIGGKVSILGRNDFSDICVDAYGSDGTWAAAGVTDEIGSYRLDGLTLGDYRLRFTDCSFFPSVITEFYRDESSLESADVVSVAKDQDRQEIDAELRDMEPPNTYIEEGPTGRILTDAAAFSFRGSADATKIQCRIDSQPFTDCTSPKTFTDLTDGPHTAYFRAEDSAGNQDQTPAIRDFTVDTIVYKAVIGKVNVKGPAKVRKGRVAAYAVNVTNAGNAQATGVRLVVSGRGIRLNAPVGVINAGVTRTVNLRLRPSRTGRVTASFKVTSDNAGSRTVKKTIAVRK